MDRIGQPYAKDSNIGFRTTYHLTDATGSEFICHSPEEFHSTVAAIRQRLGNESPIEGFAIVEDHEYPDSITQNSTPNSATPSLTA